MSVLDLVFLALVAGLLAAVAVLTRSPVRTALLVGFAIMLSGTLVQSVATLGYGWTRSSLEAWLAATLAVSVAVAWLQRRSSAPAPARTGHAFGVVLLCMAVLAIVLTLVRVLAPSDLLQSVGYLITQPVAEDNAKWLATSAQLATGAPITSFSAVGGPLLLVMTLAAAMASALSTLTLGGVNEVAVSANTTLLSQAVLICVVPFALAPLFASRLTRWTPDGQRVRGRLPYPLGILGVTIVASASILVTQFGHLTLQFVLVSFAMWVAYFAMRVRAGGAFVLTTLMTAMTAQVWFPIGTMAVVLLLALVAWGLLRARRPGMRRTALATAGAAVVILILMQEFLRSSIAFSLGTSAWGAAAAGATGIGGGAARGIAAGVRVAAESTLEIFGNPGGTEALTVTMFAVMAVCLVVSLPLLAGPQLRATGRPRLSSLAPFIPVVVLLGFATAVVLLDFWSTGKGPNYASNKMMFAAGIPILAAFLPISLLRLDAGQRRLTPTRWAAIAAIVFLLVADTFIPRAVARLKPAMFPAAGTPAPYWALAEVRDTATQPLSSNPLGCVYLPQGAERPSVMLPMDGQVAYSCSRLMSGLSGVGDTAGPFVAWQLDEWLQNTSYWDYYAPALNSIPADVRARSVILLGEKGEVVGLAPLQSLLTRYPPQPDSAQ
jgi:hypothetical protein